MNRAEKTELASTLKEKFTKASLAVVVDYKGLTASKADDFRRRLRAQKSEVKVLKNNVARMVAKDGAIGAEPQDVHRVPKTPRPPQRRIIRRPTPWATTP